MAGPDFGGVEGKTKTQGGWAYLHLEIDPLAVDVNVHPTKKEVHMMEESLILEEVGAAIQRVLSKDAGSGGNFDASRVRNFAGQSIQMNYTDKVV